MNKYLLFILVLFLILSCSKSEEPTTPASPDVEKTVAAILTAEAGSKTSTFTPTITLTPTPTMTPYFLFLGKWGRYGTGDGQFDMPVAVSIDKNTNKVYVADAGNK